MFIPRLSVLGLIQAFHGSLTPPMSHYMYDECSCMDEITPECYPEFYGSMDDRAKDKSELISLYSTYIQPGVASSKSGRRPITI